MYKNAPKYIQEIFKAFLKVIITLFNIACIGLVCWKIIEGIVKYVEKPQGTKISINQANIHKFPSMVYCFDQDEERFNEDYLEKCKIDG